MEIPPESAGTEAVVLALEKNILEMIKADRKITSLKQLQVSFTLNPEMCQYSSLYQLMFSALVMVFGDHMSMESESCMGPMLSFLHVELPGPHMESGVRKW